MDLLITLIGRGDCWTFVLLNLIRRLNLNFLKTEGETDIKLLKQIFRAFQRNMLHAN